ncbi:MAG: Hsp20/alpha crystallin family protein [Ktedonobacterales bacterium]
MALERWEPFEGLTPLREAINRLFEESFVGPEPLLVRGRGLPVDVRETDTEYSIEASLPGVKPEEIQISATEDTITISVARKEEKKEEKPGRYVRHERYEGTLSRTITLPSRISADKVTATYDHGVLTLQVPKAPEAQRKQIPVQVTPVH